jgi:hypothetical protein
VFDLCRDYRQHPEKLERAALLAEGDGEGEMLRERRGSSRRVLHACRPDIFIIGNSLENLSPTMFLLRATNGGKCFENGWETSHRVLHARRPDTFIIGSSRENFSTKLAE